MPTATPVPIMAVRPTTRDDVLHARIMDAAPRPVDADPSVSIGDDPDTVAAACVTVTMDYHDGDGPVPVAIHDTTDGYGVTDGHVWADAGTSPITGGMAVHAWANVWAGTPAACRNPDVAHYVRQHDGGATIHVC